MLTFDLSLDAANFWRSTRHKSNFVFERAFSKNGVFGGNREPSSLAL
jgi:hypothetical protein